MPRTVLLAEADGAVRHALERALTLEGYEVTAVADGVEALAQAHRKPPDVSVLDMMMPGIDGLQVCCVLRAEGDRTPILMLTAHVETADRIAGLDAGADDYIVKPSDATGCSPDSGHCCDVRTFPSASPGNNNPCPAPHSPWHGRASTRRPARPASGAGNVRSS